MKMNENGVIFVQDEFVHVPEGGNEVNPNKVDRVDYLLLHRQLRH